MHRALSLLQKHQRWLIPVGLALVYFLVQWTQLPQYGVTWDEPLHRNWGKLFYVFWKTGDRTALELMPGHGIDYGPLYYFLNYILSDWLYKSAGFLFYQANHVLTLFISSVIVGLTYILGRMIGGMRTGLLSVLFLVCFPLFIAHSHYNPKDIPLMAGILITSIIFLTALRKTSVLFFALTGFAMGFAVAMKVSALLMGPVFLAVYLLWLAYDPRSLPVRSVKRQILWFLAGSGACVFGTILFWPSAWGDPLLIPRSVGFFLGTNFWPGQVLFFGNEYGGAALPWYYIPFEFFAASPLLSLLAFGFGALVVLRWIRHRDHRVAAAFLLLWMAFPLLFSVKPGLVRYDGMRQFFFLIPACAVLAGVGLSALLVMLERRASRRWTVPLTLAIVLLSFAHEIAIVHPFEGSYRNELMRVVYPSSMDRSFQIEFWGATYKQGMDWLTDHAELNPVICVPTAGVLVEWYSWRDDFVFECSPKTNYVMFFTRYTEAGDFGKSEAVPVFTISRMGADLLKIYKVK